LENIGLRLVREGEPGATPYYGWETKDGEIRAVRAESPAEDAGISPGDTLVALGGWAVDSVEDRMRDTRPNVPVEVHCFRRGELMRFEVVPGEPKPTKYRFVKREDADSHTLALLEGWLGTTEVEGDTDDEDDDS
jgi:predicted metalloprotease with PDZ domain